MTRSRDLANLADGVEFLAADHTKLDGIETAATADQTNAEIKTAVEAASDSNVFTDADHSKLNAVEASADVTDATNVTAAGALMDSELTNIAAVKALNQGLATTASPTFAGLATTANVTFGDSDKAIFGAGSDLQIYHDGSNSIINDAGDGTIRIQTGGSNQWEFNGGTFKGNDGKKIILGDSSDLQIYHNGSHSLIEDSGQGDLKIRGANLKLQDPDGNDFISMTDTGTGGTVELKNTGTTRLATTSTGVNIGGGSSSTYALHVSNDSSQIRLQNTGSGTNGFFDIKVNATSANLVANYSSAAIPMLFHTGATERMRIDASGNVLVGKTTDAFGTAGAVIRQTGVMNITRANAGSLNLNRTGSDGFIAEFYKDGTTVGSIAAIGSRLNIISNNGSSGGGLRLDSAIRPLDRLGAVTNGATDLGASTARFKDAYLSGGVVFGPASASTVSSQTLDSYEEGTFTPQFKSNNGGNSITLSSAYGHYRKIGNQVFLSAGWVNSSTSCANWTGVFRMILPINASQGSAGHRDISSPVFNINVFSSGGQYVRGMVDANTHIDFYTQSSSAGWNNVGYSGNQSGSSYLHFSLTYRTA
jgi:hypothetical protein